MYIYNAANAPRLPAMCAFNDIHIYREGEILHICIYVLIYSGSHRHGDTTTIKIVSTTLAYVLRMPDSDRFPV